MTKEFNVNSYYNNNNYNKHIIFGSYPAAYGNKYVFDQRNIAIDRTSSQNY